MRRPHLVPISTQVRELLEEIHQLTGRGKYVFPGRNDAGKPMSEASINQVIKRILMISTPGTVTGVKWLSMQRRQNSTLRAQTLT